MRALQLQRWSLAVGAVYIVFALSACSRSEFQTTPVKGVVLCKGTPVNEGSITFSPIPKGGESVTGKPANAVIDESGRFELSTYSSNDGAIIGRHRVAYYVPEGKPGKTPCGIMVVQELEITKETREITVELSK